MNWYDFNRYEIYAGNGGRFSHRDCKRISAEEKQKIADFFSTRLIKIYFEDQSSYDNSDDERAEESYSRSSSYVYREVNVEQDLYGLFIKDGEVKGVVFYVVEGNNESAEVFYFAGKPRNTMWLGYSASHSSNWTIVCGVELVNKGENGAPTEAKEATFIQSKMYPNI